MPPPFRSLPIVSERLICRLPREEDVDELCVIFSEASARVYTPATAAPTRDAVANWAMPRLEERAGRSGLVLATKGSPNEPLGIVEVAFNGFSADLHFLIRENSRGKGYMAEALTEIMRQNPDMAPFVATIDAENEPAAKMLSKSGMRACILLTGYRVHPMLSSEPRDCLLYSTKPLGAAVGAPTEGR